MNCSTPHEFSTLQLFLFSGVRVTQSVFYAMFFGNIFRRFSFGHYIVCHFFYLCCHTLLASQGGAHSICIQIRSKKLYTFIPAPRKAVP